MPNDISKLAEFTNQILTADNFTGLSNVLIEQLSRRIKAHYISFMLFDLSSLRFVMEKRRGFHAKREIPPSLKQCDERDFLNVGTAFLMATGEDTSIFSFFDPDEPHACEVRIPFTICSNYLGLISMGKKKSGEDYSNQDLSYLQVATNFITTSASGGKLCPAIQFADNNRHHTCTGESCSRNLFLKPRIRVSRGKEDFDLLGRSSVMDNIRDMIAQVAVEDVSILITGESGTGKELIARAIHQQSRRAEHPLVAMNCAALPETLVESELFGHEKGAFTGAFEQKKGKFEYANNSTLFLDEIGDMSLSTQAKFLRVLQDGTFYRVGGNSPSFADVRIIAATNKDLYDMSMEKTFREDLYYRLNVVQIEVPPLRQRGDDVLLLSNYYFNHYNHHYGKNLDGFSEEALDWLVSYHFPGNVRELKNIIERAVILERTNKITLASFPRRNGQPEPVHRTNATLEALEKEHILSVMRQVENNKSEAARRLGIARKTLREKLQRYDVEL